MDLQQQGGGVRVRKFELGERVLVPRSSGAESLAYVVGFEERQRAWVYTVELERLGSGMLKVATEDYLKEAPPLDEGASSGGVAAAATASSASEPSAIPTGAAGEQQQPESAESTPSTAKADVIISVSSPPQPPAFFAGIASSIAAFFGPSKASPSKEKDAPAVVASHDAPSGAVVDVSDHLEPAPAELRA